MNVKVVERYVDLLTDIIDKKVRSVNDRKVLFDKQYILNVLNKNQFDDTQITEKIFKDTIKWFKERHIFTTIGNTSNLKYQLHPSFNFKLSKSRDMVRRQCQFIIGQLFLFSNNIYDDSQSVYIEVMKSETIFQLLPTIKPKVVRDTVSSLILHKHNKENDGVYPYEILQTLLTSKTPFNIKLKNKSINSTLKGVTLKKMVFNTDTVSLTFNNSSFEIDSLNNIKDIKIQLSKDIYENIDTSLEYLRGLDTDVSSLIGLLNEIKNTKEMFFVDILEDQK